MYLIIMAIICLFSIEFVSINMGITKVGQLEQYVEDYIELNGQCTNEYSLDAKMVEAINEELAENNMSFSYEYVKSTEEYAYYSINVKYKLRTVLFNLGKEHTFKGIARVSI